MVVRLAPRPPAEWVLTEEGKDDPHDPDDQPVEDRQQDEAVEVPELDRQGTPAPPKGAEKGRNLHRDDPSALMLSEFTTATSTDSTF